MALVCQKITRINTYFKKVFLDCLNFELPKLELSHAAHVLRNIKLSRLEDLNKFKVLELEKFLLKQIEEKINSKENFGNDSMVNLFKFCAEMYVINQGDANYKNTLIRIAKEMNENPKLYKKKDLEAIINLLSDMKLFEVRSSLPSDFNLFRKIKKSPQLYETKLYTVNYDIERALIILTDKKNVNHNIIFAQLTHNGAESQVHYSSLIKSMNPAHVLIENEPYSRTSHKIDSGRIYKDVSNISKFHSLSDFKIFIKDLGYFIKGDNVVSSTAFKEVESIVYYSLCKNFNVSLFDVPIHNFTKSFCHYERNIEHLGRFCNILEVISWLSLQEKIGCKTCAGYFDRQILNWVPNHLEFIIPPSMLPNFDFLSSFKVRKVYETVKNNPLRNTIVFCSNARSLCESFLEYLDRVEINAMKPEDHMDFDDYFDDKEFTDQVELVSLALHLKENYEKYLTDPPLRLKGVQEESLKKYQKSFYDKFTFLYGLDDKEFPFFEQSLPKNKAKEILKGKSLALNKEKSCEPEKFCTNLFKFKDEIKNLL